jgi:hypothetical protein
MDGTSWACYNVGWASAQIGVDMSIEELTQEILNLNSAERSHMIDLIINSLDYTPGIDDAAVDEAVRRSQEIHAGTATLVPAASVFASRTAVSF